MMNLEKMKKRKKELGMTNQELSERSGVPLGTVNKIFSGATKSPQYDTILALETVLGMTFYRDEDGPYVSSMREEAFHYTVHGSYTPVSYTHLIYNYSVPYRKRPGHIPTGSSSPEASYTLWHESLPA